MPTNLLYDISVEETLSSHGKCIRAPESVFRMVAGMLYKLATEKPDSALINDLKGFLIVDHTVQAQFLSFAMQCLTDALCGEDEEMPQNLRTKPTDICVLQQEQEGDYVDVFDFGACLSTFFDTLNSQQAQNQLATQAPALANSIMEDFNASYTGTSASVDPDLVISGASAGVNRSALCTALKTIVKGYADDSAKLKQEESENYNRASLLTALGAGAIALVGAIAAIPTLGASAALSASLVAYLGAGNLVLAGAVLGVTATGLSIYAQNVKDTSLAVFQDQAAINAVTCAWYLALKDQADISQTEYAAALTIPPTPPNAQALYDAIKPLIEQTLSYAVFLRAWKQEIVTRAIVPTIVDSCECEATVRLYATNGVDGVHLIYEGVTNGFDTYLLKARYTGHYATFGAMSENNVPFYVVDYEVPAGTPAWTSGVIGFAGGNYTIENLPNDIDSTTISIAMQDNVQLRIWVSP